MEPIQGQETGTDYLSPFIPNFGFGLGIGEMPSQGLDVDTGGDEGNDPEGDDGDPNDSQDTGLAGGFLKDIPAEHQKILEPYVKKWDAGVQRRFQELHGQYRPYEELGVDVDTIQQGIQLLDYLQNDPVKLYQALREAGVTEEELGQEEPDYSSEEFQLPAEYQQKIGRMEQALASVAQWILDQQKTSQESEEDAELDQYLGYLKDEFGDFDEEFVLARMYAGATGEEAVKAWNERVQNILKQNGGQLATSPVLGGGGSVAMEDQDPRKLGRKDVQGLVASVIAQTKAQGA